jgi:hypothetical protein
MRRLDALEVEPATWPDGEPRYRVGLDRERTLEAAIREARECAEADPGVGFVVIDAEGVTVHELVPAGVCPF